MRDSTSRSIRERGDAVDDPAVHELLRLSATCAGHLPLVIAAAIDTFLLGGAVLGHLRRTALERALASVLALLVPVAGVLAVGAGRAAVGGSDVVGHGLTAGSTGIAPLASRIGVRAPGAWSPQGVPVLVIAAAAAGACIGLLIVTARNREREIHDVRARRLAGPAAAETLRGWGLRVFLVAGTALLVAGMIGLFAHDVLGTPTTWGGLLASF